MSTTLTPQLRGRIENTIRFLAADAVQAAKSGHPGAPMGLARPVFELWNEHLRFDPTDPAWPLRDRFVLSNGHASMLQYALLHLFGFDLSLDDIRNFRQLGSRTPGHPEYGDTPGIEVTTGPLGQGFAHGVGMALAGRMTAARFGVDGSGPGAHHVYAVVSDGDLMEGVSAEAGSLAGHLGLGNLIYLYDDNLITIDGPTELCFSENVRQRFEAQRWHVEEVDGEDVDGLSRALAAARAEGERPSMVITRTLIGRGSPNKAGQSSAHGNPLGDDEIQLAKEAVGWPVEPRYHVPVDVRDYLAERITAKRAARAEDDAGLALWRGAHPDRAAAWDVAREKRMPSGLGETLCDGLEGVDNATRNHSAAVLEKLSEAAPYLVGGSADLAGSAAPPVIKGRGVIGPGAADGSDPFAGQNIYFGVREHAMGAITNGIALDGTFLPYSGTFLIFSDYMRPSIRLAALMKLRSLFVFTHDSIYVGEDGPTHQPIEQLDALRAIPGLRVFRPADGIETAMVYAWIAQHADGPAALALTRQPLPALKRDAAFRPEDVWAGAYAVIQPGGQPDVVIAATGSEVSLACETASLLTGQGLAARVVSIPCVELFLDQSQAEREKLLPVDGTPVVAIEASRGQSLWRLVGPRGTVMGLDGFGASAPWTVLSGHFGLQAAPMAERIAAFVRG